MAFYETGGRGDKYNYSFDQEFVSGAIGVGPTSSSNIWQQYGMPKPTCAEGWDVTSYVHNWMSCGGGPGSTTDSANFPANQERRGDCDQWRSSCEMLFMQYLVEAGNAVRVVQMTSKLSDKQQGHLTPCAFSEIWQQAMSAVNDAVGSWDQSLNYAWPNDQSSPAYVPRMASLIFGGDDYASNWPTFDASWNKESAWYQCIEGESQHWAPIEYFGDGDTLNQCGYTTVGLSRRVKVSNGEFCRGVMEKTYPCSIGASSAKQTNPFMYDSLLPALKIMGDNLSDPNSLKSAALGACGGCKEKNLVGTCTDDHCPHHPLEWWQKQFTNLRLRLLAASDAYYANNAKTMGGMDFDAYCAKELATSQVDAPTQSDSVYIQSDIEAAQITAEKIKAYNESLGQSEVLSVMLNDLTTAPAGFPTWAKIGGAALGSLIIFQLVRG